MIGMKTGETKVLNLTFPEDYNEELGGKAVEFTVTMNSVSRAPETLTRRMDCGKFRGTDRRRVSSAGTQRNGKCKESAGGRK